MAKKSVSGEIRNKEKTKQKLLHAVGKIITAKGHSKVKVNTVAEVSGVNKRLIYDYFGGLDGLIDAYISQVDYWSRLRNADSMIKEDNGQQFTTDMLLGLFDAMQKDKEMQKIIVWELSEYRRSLRAAADKREEDGELIFGSVIDPYFGNHAGRFRAITALLISGAYYLTIHTEVNGGTFCGLDLKSENGRNEIREAIRFVIKQAYETV